MKTQSRLAHYSAIIAIVFSSLILTATVVFADEVSAPQVVAPAQPAGAASIGATGTAAATSGNAAITTTTAVAAPTTPQTPADYFRMALPLIIMLGVMYFIAIRPQQKKMKEHQTLIGGLKSGDEVITSSGILGTITGMSDKVVNLEISKNVQIKILKSQVNQVVKGNLQEIQS